MKPRAEVAAFIREQFKSVEDKPAYPKGSQWHYGRQDLRELLDFLYGEPPKSYEEKL